MDAVQIADALRILIGVVAAIGVAFMCATNIIAFMVLRPPKRLGFLWWHVTSISISFLVLGVLALDDIYLRFGEDPSWRLPAGLGGFSLFATAQIIIFNVERSRYAQRRAMEGEASERGKS